MAKIQFHDLSADVKALIVEEVLRPSDLKNICLVSKELHQLAVKRLYREVSLTLGSSQDNRLSALLSTSNIGLKHVRRLRLDLAEERSSSYRRSEDRGHRNQQAHLMARMILEFLPEDVLEEFKWCPRKPFSADNLLLLYRRQRKLQRVQVLPLDRDVLSGFEEEQRRTGKVATKEALRHVRRLHLNLRFGPTLRLAQIFLEATDSTLDTLTVRADFAERDHHRRFPSPDRPNDAFPRDVFDSATAPGLLTRTIFAHKMPFDKCAPFAALTTLNLKYTNLRHCDSTWCRVIDFTRLKQIRLSRCHGADALIGEMSKSRHLPTQLKVLAIKHREHSTESADVLLALDGFLCKISSLRDLALDLDNVDTLPNAACIALQGKNLEILNIHCSASPSRSRSSGGRGRPPTPPPPGGPGGANSNSSEEGGEHWYSATDLETIVTACSNISQLSLAWPRTSLFCSPPKRDFRVYESAVLLGLRKLKTLHISTWPTASPAATEGRSALRGVVGGGGDRTPLLRSGSSNSSREPLLGRAAYAALLQALALRAFILSAASAGSNGNGGSGTNGAASSSLFAGSAAPAPSSNANSPSSLTGGAGGAAGPTGGAGPTATGGKLRLIAYGPSISPSKLSRHLPSTVTNTRHHHIGGPGGLGNIDININIGPGGLGRGARDSNPSKNLPSEPLTFVRTTAFSAEGSRPVLHAALLDGTGGRSVSLRKWSTAANGSVGSEVLDFVPLSRAEGGGAAGGAGRLPFVNSSASCAAMNASLSDAGFGGLGGDVGLGNAGGFPMNLDALGGFGPGVGPHPPLAPPGPLGFPPIGHHHEHHFWVDLEGGETGEEDEDDD